MEKDPAWLRWLAGVKTPEQTRIEALDVFKELGSEQSLGPAGYEAFAVTYAIQFKRPVLESLSQVLGGTEHSTLTSATQTLTSGEGNWWLAHLATAFEKNQPKLADWAPRHQQMLTTLRTRAIAARSSIWLIGIAGLAFFPITLRSLRSGLKTRLRGYSSAWLPSLGLATFFAATLAWIGFSMTLDLGLANFNSIHPLLALLLDSFARFLPAFIAIGLLFKRPTHSIRVLGINQPIHPGPVLGLFSLLLILDQILNRLLGDFGTANPGGGLSLSDQGISGLVFLFISACIVAPISEEILYRGVLFRSLGNRLGILPAAILSSLIFAVFHFYNLYGLCSVAIFGGTCALLYAGTGSLAAVIALHALYNASIKIPEWIVYHSPLS